jgi:hypothetical protein
MAKTERHVPGNLTAAHIIGVTEGSSQPTVYFQDADGHITRFTQRHKNPDNIGYHPAKGDHVFFGNVSAGMFVKAGANGQATARSWGSVARELQEKNWKAPASGGRKVLFEVVATDDGGVSLHRSRAAFKEITDIAEKQRFFAQLQGPNVYKAMDPQTHEFYFTATPLQANAAS